MQDDKPATRSPREYWIVRIDGDTACFIYDNPEDADKRLLSGIKLPSHWIGRNPYRLHVYGADAYQSLLAERDALRKSQADRMVHAAGTLSALAVERDQLLAQAEALAGALEKIVRHDKRLPDFTDNPQTMIAHEALTAYRAFRKGEGGARG